nr:hypothetical protein [Tanacetum cinerariifolium]
MLTQFPNQTSIYTPTVAYVIHLYRTSPRREYLLEFTSEYGISEALYPELPGPGERIVDFPEGKDEMPAENTYFPEAVMILNTHRTPIQKQPETLLCLVGSSRRYFQVDDVYPTFLHDDDRDMDLFNLIRAPNPTKVKTGTRPRAAYKVPILTVTASREAVAPKVPPPENVTTTGVAPEACQAEGIAATGPHVIKERRKRGNDGVDINAPPKVPRRDHPVPASRGAPVDVSDPDPLSFADPQSRPTADIFQGNGRGRSTESENTSFTSMVGSPESIYRPKWGVTNGCLLNAPEACQDLVDHIAPPGYILELRHLHNDDFLKQYNVNLARQVAMGSQLQLRENEIKNLETLLEAKTDIKKTTEGKIAELSKELENLRALFSDLQVSNNRLSQQRCAEMDARLDALGIDFDEELYPHMLTAIAGRRWVIGHGLRLAVMKCGESTELRQVFANVVSAGIAKGMSEGLKYEVEHGKANLSLEAIEAYDPEAEAKYIAALHALKDLKHVTPTDPWACKEEILLADAIAANVSRAEKKKKCRVVCRTHGVSSAHHAMSDGVSVSVPTVAPQGLAIRLEDAATQQKYLRMRPLPVMDDKQS